MRISCSLLAGLGIIVSGAGLAGCTAQLQLWSDPAGAIIVENGTGKTYRTPVTINYSPTAKDRDAQGCFSAKGYSATWQSGAKASSPPLIRLCGLGPLWSYKFERPADAPNLAADLAVQNQIVARQQAEAAAKQQAGAELLGAFLSGMAQGYAERGSRPVYVPSVIPTTTTPNQTSTEDSLSLPQITPNGTYVSGSKPYSICPNGQYVSGNCTITPNGTYVGQ